MTILVAISKATALDTQRQVLGCETCTDDAEIPLNWILDRVTGRSGANSDYVLSEPLKCPRCIAAIREETLVEWE